jgi:ribosome maturation factor RimP
LVKLADFDRFKGFEAKVESDAPINGRKRFTGRLQGVDGDNVVILFDGAPVSVPFVHVAKAKLVITDELLAAAEATETQKG